MSRPIDVIDMLRQANPVPPGSADDGQFPTVAELRATWRSQPADPATVVWDQGPVDRPRRWPKYFAVAALAAGVVALFLVPPEPEAPVEPATSTANTTATTTADTIVDSITEESSFVGVWVSNDSDGSFQTMEVQRADGDEFELTVHDDFATVCLGAPSTMTGTGQLEAVDTLVFPQPVMTCDDGTTPEIDGAPPGQELVDRLANLTFVRDPASAELFDSLDVAWQRANLDTSGSPLTPNGGPAAARANVSALIDAINAATADESLDETSLPDVFTADATISAFAAWGDLPVSEPGVLGTWIDHLQTWGFTGSPPICAPEIAQLTCTVRARWETVSADADETWGVVWVGERIQKLTVYSSGQRFSDPLLPLSLAELADWERWLRDTDPATADRLLTPVDIDDELPLVPRYDPALAGEIGASIQQYIELQPSRDDITVSADRVNFGDRLSGSTDAVVRADGRIYVLAGRYEIGTDPSLAAEVAVLAAFDDAGAELWRTEVDGRPHHLEAVGGDLWVIRRDATLSRIDSSNGEVLDEVTVGDTYLMTGAFGSVWIETFDPTENAARLVRVAADLSVTRVDLPGVDADAFYRGDYEASGPTAGAGAMWVPLDGGGLARIDPATMEMTVMSAEEIGHDVLSVAFDGDVAYAASRSQVTSIVGGEVGATASTDDIWYLGPIGDLFGVLGPTGQFEVLTPDGPLSGDVHQMSTEGQSGTVGEIDGEAWVETGANDDLRRVELVPSPERDNG